MMYYSKNSFSPISRKGFTLAELLIALAVLGTIATFTIPKLLTSTANARFNAQAKEVAATITSAYQAYKLQNNVVPTQFNGKDLRPFLNYVADDEASQIDEIQTRGTVACSNTTPCIQLHNGGRLLFWEAIMSDTTSNNAVWFLYDPDGKVTDGSTDGPGKGIEFVLYYNGKLATNGTILPGTVNSIGTFNPIPATDPPWFSWN